MNAPHSSDFFFNTLTGMLELLKNTRRDKMRQNETVGARALPELAVAVTHALNGDRWVKRRTAIVVPNRIGAAGLHVEMAIFEGDVEVSGSLTAASDTPPFDANAIPGNPHCGAAY